MFPAIFIDRDGVLIENLPDYVRSTEQVKILAGSLSALAGLRDSPYKIVIVTNQSAVGRGIISLERAHSINRFLITKIEQAGGRIDGVFMCPHAPEDRCECRKPRPGLILQAARALSIDLSRSVMIGDALSDVLAGRAAGVGRTVLVRTGRGADQLRLPDAGELKPLIVHDSLAAALAALFPRGAG